METNFSKDIAMDEENLSPVLAALVGLTMMPEAYGKIAEMATASVDGQCALLSHNIDK